MGELVSAIAKSLVENPEAVEVSEEQSNGTTVVQLKVAPDDMGKVIGKAGPDRQSHPNCCESSGNQG